MLKARGIEVVNYGTDTESSVDYPDYAHRLAQAVESHEVDLGIALCGTGNGMAITLNKHQGIRAGLAWGTAIGHLVAQHNNANVLVLPASPRNAGKCRRFRRKAPSARIRSRRCVEGFQRDY